MESFYDVTQYLRPRGFDYLTGESCAYGLRLLFDITPAAADKLAEFLGAVEVTGASAWNGQHGTTQSVTLSRGMVRDLVIFLLLEEHDAAIRVEGVPPGGYHPGNDFYAGTAAEMNQMQRILSDSDVPYRYFLPIGGPRKGGRAVHAMSGRAE